MATILSMKSLEELCLTHVAMTMEQYSTDSLSLLPKGFRLQLLHKIPIIDVCRLEDTKFTTGIDMTSVWVEIYQQYIGINRYNPRLDSRESFFRQLFIVIIRGERPYGYCQVQSQRARQTPWIGSNMNEDCPVSEYKVDVVNFLVAVKREVPVVTTQSLYRKVDSTMTRHEVTLVKGPVPPGKAYH